MLKIRYGTFETNSSSTHSIIICSRKQFEEWKSGKCLFNPDSDTFYNPSTKIEDYRKEAVEQYKRAHDHDPYCKSWNELSSDLQQKYIEAHVKYKIEAESYEDSRLTYDDYKRYYKEGCMYTEVFFTTEHGDEVVAFGKGGYD